MPTYHRWFLLPTEEYTDENDDPINAPAYVYPELGDRLSGFSSGGPFSRTQVEDAGYAGLLAFNDAENWRVVVAWGDDNPGWNALNEIHAMHNDTDTLADHGQDVAPVMDERFGAGNWSIDALALDGSENTA